jgi:hypothetical protein
MQALDLALHQPPASSAPEEVRPVRRKRPVEHRLFGAVSRALRERLPGARRTCSWITV